MPALRAEATLLRNAGFKLDRNGQRHAYWTDGLTIITVQHGAKKPPYYLARLRSNIRRAVEKRNKARRK